MIIDIIKLFSFLAIIIVPLAVPPKRKQKIYKQHPSAKMPSAYYINEDGGLEVKEESTH